MVSEDYERRFKRRGMLLWLLTLTAWSGIAFFGILVDRLEAPTTPQDLYALEIEAANREYSKVFEAEDLAEARTLQSRLRQSPLLGDGGFLKNPQTQIDTLDKLSWALHVLELRVKASSSAISLESNIYKLAPKGFQIEVGEEGLDVGKHLRWSLRDVWISECDLKFRASDEARILPRNRALESQKSTYVASIFISFGLAVLLSLRITFRNG